MFHESLNRIKTLKNWRHEVKGSNTLQNGNTNHDVRFRDEIDQTIIRE